VKSYYVHESSAHQRPPFVVWHRCIFIIVPTLRYTSRPAAPLDPSADEMKVITICQSTEIQLGNMTITVLAAVMLACIHQSILHVTAIPTRAFVFLRWMVYPQRQGQEVKGGFLNTTIKVKERGRLSISTSSPSNAPLNSDQKPSASIAIYPDRQ
jgi:hypothetical protein